MDILNAFKHLIDLLVSSRQVHNKLIAEELLKNRITVCS